MRSNKYDLKIKRQARKHAEKRERILEEEADSTFRFESRWNPDADGALAIATLLLFHQMVVVNANHSGFTQHRAPNQRAIASTNNWCPIEYNATSHMSGTNDIQPLVLGVSRELNDNSQVHVNLSKCYWSKNSRRLPRNSSCAQNVIEGMPHYIDLKIWKDWYDDVKYLPGGRSKHVLTAILKHDRRNAAKGDKIVLVTSSLKHYWYSRDLINYCEQFSILSNYNGKPVVGFYPEIFGVYQGDHFHIDMIPSKYEFLRNVHNYNLAAEVKMSYVEMEYLEGNKDIAPPYQDSVIFEGDLSEWASRKIAGCVQGDDNSRHRLLVMVSYYRAYHIGTEIYLFAPGPMPKMIDLDTTTCSNFIEIYKSLYLPNEAQSEEAKKVVLEMGERGIFNVFLLYFDKYKMSNTSQIPSKSEVRHYYIPDEYLHSM